MGFRRGDEGAGQAAETFPTTIDNLLCWYLAGSGYTFRSPTSQFTDPTDFSTASWYNENITVVPDAIASPLGGLAQKLVATSTVGANVHVLAQGMPTESQRPTQMSCVVKAAGYNYVALAANNAAVIVLYDLANATGTALTAGASNIKITPMGDGWYVCLFIYTPEAGTGSGLVLIDNTPSAEFIGDDASGVYASEIFLYQPEISGWDNQIATANTDLTVPGGGALWPLRCEGDGAEILYMFPGSLQADPVADGLAFFPLRDGTGVTAVMTWDCGLTTAGDSQYIWDTTGDESKAGFFARYNGTAGNLEIGVRNATTRIIFSEIAADALTPNLTIFRYTEGASPEWSVYHNGQVVDSGNTTGAPAGGGVGGDSLVFGTPSSGAPAAGTVFIGVIADQLIYTASITDQECDDLFAYYATRYPLDTGGEIPTVSTLNAGSYFQGDWAHSNQDQIDYVAQAHDIVICSVGATNLGKIKTSNPNITALRYHKLQGVKPTDSIYARCVSEGVIPWLDDNGVAVTNVVNGWYYVDIQDETKRAAWIQIVLDDLQAPLLTEGYDGIMFDDVDVLDPLLAGTASALPAGYDNAIYYPAMGEIMDAVKTVHPTKYMLFNSYRGSAAEGYRDIELLVDGLPDALYFEAFAYQVGGNYWSTIDRYDQQIGDFYTACTTTGKQAFALDYGSISDTSRRLFSFGTYLLVQNGQDSYWRYGGTDATNDLQDYPEYHVTIGNPTAEYVRTGTDVFYRVYSDGIVVVNPNATTKSYVLAEDQDLLSVLGGGSFPTSGTATWTLTTAQTLTLAARTAYIFKDPTYGGLGVGGNGPGTYTASASPLSWDSVDYDEPAFGGVVNGAVFAIAGGTTWATVDGTTIANVPNGSVLPDFDAVLMTTGGQNVTMYLDSRYITDNSYTRDAAGAQDALINVLMIADAVVMNYKADALTHVGPGQNYLWNGLTGFENAGAVTVTTGYTAPPVLTYVAP